MTAFIPLYVRHFFNDDPHFEDAKIVFTCTMSSRSLDKDLAKKAHDGGLRQGSAEGPGQPHHGRPEQFAIGLSDAW
jgi:hypothetical protein